MELGFSISELKKFLKVSALTFNMAFDLNAFLAIDIGSNKVQSYAIAIIAFLSVTVVLVILKLIFRSHLKKLSEKTRTRFDDVMVAALDQIGIMFYVLVGIIIAIKFLVIEGIAKEIIDGVLFIGIAFYIVRFLQKIIKYLITTAIKKRKEVVDETALSLLSNFIGIALWIIAFVWIISNLGYDVTALVAGLGIGGLAIAFALQRVLEDIFASFSIYLDKPFKAGDFIVVGDSLGVVKKIGIKTTRIESLHGEEIVMSNRELTSTTIHNYKKMQKRRVVIQLGVTYDTSSKKLEKIPTLIKDIITKVKLADFDRAHFNIYGDFALNFEVVYYVNSSDYNQHMDTQQEILLEIKRAFEKEKIEFAYPTQTVFVKK